MNVNLSCLGILVPRVVRCSSLQRGLRTCISNKPPAATTLFICGFHFDPQEVGQEDPIGHSKELALTLSERVGIIGVFGKHF